MDAASVLEQYVSDLTNLPAEIAYILEEIGDKDVKFYETRRRIQQRDNQIHKFIRANGSLADNPREASSYPKIRADFEKAMAIQQAKCDLANTGLYIISRQVKKLQDDITKLEEEGLLASTTGASGLDGFLSNYTSDASYASSRRNSVSARATSTRPPSALGISSVEVPYERKRTSPAPGSRGTTPLGRPQKRQKVAVAAPASPDSDTSGPSTPNVGRHQLMNRPVGSLGANGDHEEEVLYCMCQQVSFGNMVACDNPDCQYEWFHYDCVGLKEPPSGTWYCPTCTKERKEARDAGDDFRDTSTKRRR